jgi:hypothetical protein
VAFPVGATPGRLAVILAAALLAVAQAGCGGGGSTPPAACTVSSVTVNTSAASIPSGGTATLGATLAATPGCNTALTWSVTPDGGTLTPSGATATFASKNPAAYTITATSVADNTRSGSATVTVDPAPSCAVTGVIVNASAATIPLGGTSTLAATLVATPPGCSTALTWSVTPDGGSLSPSGATATFSSSTEASYTIRATSDADNTKSGSATVTVSPAATCTVAGVTVNTSAASIPSGGTATLGATLAATPGCNTALTWSVAPDGGALTSSGAAATFTSTTQATYSITATSVADNTKSGSATVTVTPPVPCGQANGTVVRHGGTISASETWAGDGVTHTVQGSVDITGTAVVTIEACALVLLGPSVSISTFDSGRLVSLGTGAGRNVTFSARDAGLRWGMLRAFSPTSLIDLRFTTVREGGEQGIFFSTTLAGLGAGYDKAPAKVLRVINVDVEGSSGIGVYLDFNGAFTDDSVGLTVVNSGSNPVYANMMSLGSLPAGSYTGNARKEGADEILVRGPNADVFADLSIKALGVPIRVPFAAVAVRPVAPATTPITLTLQPGVVLKFPRVGTGRGALVTFGTNGSAPDNLVGVLNAVGTPALPIVFTSGEAAPAPGDWAGLWLDTATGSRLDHVEISYAGAPNGIVSDNCRPAGSTDAAALIVGSFSTQYVPPADLVTNSAITDSAGFGINAVWQAATASAPNLTPTNTFLRNAGCRQTFNGLTAGGPCPVLGCTAD